MSDTAKMNPTAYDWHQNDSVQKLRDMIIISAQQIESAFHTEFPIETMLLCGEFLYSTKRISMRVAKLRQLHPSIIKV